MTDFWEDAQATAISLKAQVTARIAALTAKIVALESEKTALESQRTVLQAQSDNLALQALAAEYLQASADPAAAIATLTTD